MNTTLNIIKSKQPCSSGWSKLLLSLGKTEADDEPLSLKYILGSNGTQDAIWALRCFDYKEYCLFLAEVADSVLPIFEKCNPLDDRLRKAIEAIRSFQKGSIIKEDLKTTYSNAAAAAAAALDAATHAYTHDDTNTYAAVAAAAYAYTYAAEATAYDYAAAYDAARCLKWTEIEELFVSYFC